MDILYKYSDWNSHCSLLIPYKEQNEFKKTPIDYKGFVLFGISITLLLLSTNIKHAIWYVMIGIIGMTVFVFIEQKEKESISPSYRCLKIKASSW